MFLSFSASNPVSEDLLECTRLPVSLLSHTSPVSMSWNSERVKFCWENYKHSQGLRKGPSCQPQIEASSSKVDFLITEYG